jgi:hypothetical protein
MHALSPTGESFLDNEYADKSEGTLGGNPHEGGTQKPQQHHAQEWY